MKWSDLSLPPNNSLKEIKPNLSSTSNEENSFIVVCAKRRLQAKKPEAKTKMSTCPQDRVDTVNAAEISDNEGLNEASHLFRRHEGCIKSYQTFSGLQNHLDIGRHIYALEKQTLLDKAMIQYGTRLEQGSTEEVPTIEAEPMQTAPRQQSSVKMGWALNSNKGHKCLNETQKDYLMAQLKIGEQTGHNVDPVTASKSMRKAKNADSVRLFSPEEFLTLKQIASFFSRVSRKRVVPEELDINAQGNVQSL